MVAIVYECLAALSLVRRLQFEFSRFQYEENTEERETCKPKEALLTFMQRLCGHCWNAVGGPRKPGMLTGICMAVAAQSMPLPSNESLMQHCMINEPFRDVIASLPANYALSLLPFVTMRLLCSSPDSSLRYSLLETNFPAHLMSFLVSNDALCEVSETDLYLP